jgi:hypothetical protein
MKRKNMAAGDGYWKKQVDEFCGLFGFWVDRRELWGLGPDEAKDVYMLKSGRSTVAYKDESRTWSSRELPLEAVREKFSGTTFEDTMEALVRTASGKELIVRSSDKDRKTPYGFTKVRLIRHIRLPEFGSVEELKLKLAASGEGEP